MADNEQQLTAYGNDRGSGLNGRKTYTTAELMQRRMMFYGGIVVWVVILFIPFFFVLLSIQGEMRFRLPGDYPDNQLRIWMVSERAERGIAYSRPHVVDRTEQSLYVQTSVRYMLWEGENEFLRYCVQYSREDADGAWLQETSSEGPCTVDDV